MGNTLWLVKNCWMNQASYEDADCGTDVIGVFDDFDLAVEAIRKIYKREFDVSVMNEAMRYVTNSKGRADMDWVYDYAECIDSEDRYKCISWTGEGEWDINSFDYEYYIDPINMNEARHSW